jgi:hypothetical protein
MRRLFVMLLALGLPTTALAGTVTTDGSRTRVGVNDRDSAFPGITQDAVYYSSYVPSFNVAAAEGRVSASSDQTWLEGPDGHHWTSAGIVDLAAAAGTVEDVGDILFEHYFTTTQTVSFAILGSFLATGNGDAYLFSVELRDQGADLLSAADDVVVYAETGALGSGSSFNYTLGSSPSVGTNTGTIGPGSYRLLLGPQLRDADGDGVHALGTFTGDVRIGAVPEPSGPALLVLAACMLVVLPWLSGPRTLGAPRLA